MSIIKKQCLGKRRKLGRLWKALAQLEKVLELLSELTADR